VISNLVLDTLFSRRPKIRYVSPPICGLIQSPTSSGAPAVSLETISPLGTVHYFFTDGGLTWDSYPGAICYNVYRSNLGSTSFLGIVECGPQQILPVDPGCYVVTGVTQDGETPFGQPICTQTHIPPCSVPVHYFITDAIGGLVLRWDAFPDATCYNVYQDGTKIQSCIPLQDVPVSPPLTGQTCFVVTAIAPCGETPQSTPVCLSPPPPPPLRNGLVGYWPLDEQVGVTPVYNPPAIDFSGNGENLPLTNGPSAQSNTGLVNRCFFQSTSANLSHPDDAFLGMGPGKSFTMTGWTLGIGYGFSSAIVYSKWSVANKDYAVYIADDGVNFQLKFTAYDLTGSPQTAIYAVPVAGRPNNTDWHFIAFGYDDSLQQIWLQLDNGTKVTAPCVGVHRTVAPFGLADTTNTADIAPSAGSIGNYDETAFWDRPLTAAELTLIYNTNLGGQPLSILI